MVCEISYCEQVVRGQDADRYLLCQFAPAGLRPALYALFAFHCEIAKTRDVVSETQLGLIRLQWWRDAIGKLYSGEVLEFPVLQGLAQVIREHDLDRADFEALIYAREFDLEDVRPSTLEGLLQYCDYTGTPLLRMVGKVLGAEGEPLSVIAGNYGLVGVLRSVGYFAQKRRCLLPEAVMEARGVKLNQLYDPPSPKASARRGGKLQEGMVGVIEECAGAFVGGVRAEHRVFKAMQKLAEVNMGHVRRCGYDVFDPRYTLPPAFKVLRVVLNL
ncbi:MAG: phytoene/squalene synthase family protein [Alphaproteobacteria bacterium]